MAAACVFLCGKSEECPRKLEHLVRSWFSLKYPNVKIDQQVCILVLFCVQYRMITKILLQSIIVFPAVRGRLSADRRSRELDTADYRLVHFFLFLCQFLSNLSIWEYFSSFLFSINYLLQCSTCACCCLIPTSSTSCSKSVRTYPVTVCCAFSNPAPWLSRETVQRVIMLPY